MKTVTFIILLALNFNSFSQSVQDSLKYKVTYELNFQPDSTDVNSKKAEIMWLFTGDKSSLFLSKPRALKDTLSEKTDISQIGSQAWKDKTAATKTDFNFKIYKNRNLGTIFYAEKIFQDQLYYSEPVSEIKWKIENETKQLYGYLAQKATTLFAGRNYVAWFTSEIPIPDGPYKFSGLPGLILEVSDLKNEYVFKFQGFSNLEEPIVIASPPKGYKQSSKEELIGLKNQYEEDPIKYINNYVGEGGSKVTISFNSGSDKQKYRKKQKTKLANRNNPIELKQLNNE